MPLNTTDLLKMKEQVETAKQEASKAEGALSQIMLRLKSDFDCKTLDAAKSKLKELEQQASAAEKEFESSFTNFKAKYGERL